MKSIHQQVLRAGTLSAAMLALALGPLNTGGCASGGGSGGGGIGGLGNMVGSAVGGTTGNLISAGGKAADAAALDESKEDAFGQSVAVAITNRYGLDANEQLNKYVNLVGLTLSSVTAQPDGNWVFGVLNTDEVNAFAGPNGYIMITRGALMRMQDESELAGVLAHEIAHVVRKHGLNAVKQAGYMDAVATAAKSSADVAKFGAAVDGATDVIGNKGYGREQEADADLVAVTYLTRAGYDPNGYVRFLQRMASTNGSAGAGRLMSTHPGLGDRAAKVQARIKSDGAAGGATLAERFRKYVPKPVT